MNKNDIMKQCMELYTKGNFQESYDYITNATKDMSPHSGFYNIRYCLASLLGNKELAMTLLKEAIIDCDFWYGSDILLQDADLEVLRSHKDFSKVLEINNKKAEHNRFVDSYREDVDSTSNQLLIALHGNMQSLETLKHTINQDTVPNTKISYIRASQQRMANAYIWNDFNRSVDEVSTHYKALKEKYSITDKDITISTFSASGTVVLNSVIEGHITAKNLIFFGPWLPELDQVKDKISVLKDNNINVYVACGELDNVCLGMSNKFVEELKRHDVSYRYDVIPNLAHDLPKGFQNYYKKIKQFFDSNNQ